MPVQLSRTWLQSAGMHLPGEPIGNDRIDEWIAPLNRASARIRRRILQENGIRTRHYAIDPEGRPLMSHAALAAAAVRDCLARAQAGGSVEPQAGRPTTAEPTTTPSIATQPMATQPMATQPRPTLLAVGSSGGDALVPGFALSVQGELGLPPMQTLSSLGVCAAGVSAIEFAAQAIELGNHDQALAVGADMPSRLFKRSRFVARDQDTDFDAHFLRWMLSDGAGALLLGNAPRSIGLDGLDGRGLDGRRLAVRLDWIHQRSFAGDYPVCMQLGLSEDRSTSFLDFASSAQAEAAGALALRQDIRLLPHLFDVSIHEHLKLVREGWIEPSRIDHFLCHYSSARFQPIVAELLDKAGCTIPPERWYSNLGWRGNTGAASIFVMLAEFLATHPLAAGQRIYCFVPESGRISAAFLMFSVHPIDVVPAPGRHQPAAAGTNVKADVGADVRASTRAAAQTAAPDGGPYGEAGDAAPPPHDPHTAAPPLRPILTALSATWHDYRSRVWRCGLIRRIVANRLTVADYAGWAGQWVPQVREGSRWMRAGAAAVSASLAPLAALIEHHAGDEQDDFRILYDDYRAAGGTLALDALRRNPGGEALNAFLHATATGPEPVGLLGAIYIIEGTGQRIIPALLPLIRRQLPLPASAFRFLAYHGANDTSHLARWLAAVDLALCADPAHERAIVETARHTAELYRLQFDLILTDLDQPALTDEP